MTDTIRCACPACGEITTQTVFHHRLLAPVHWCLACFATIVQPPSALNRRVLLGVAHEDVDQQRTADAA